MPSSIASVASCIFAFAIYHFFASPEITKKPECQDTNYQGYIAPEIILQYRPNLSKITLGPTAPIKHTIAVQLCVNEFGVPYDVEITKSKPTDIFDEVTLEAVSKNRYKPAILLGGTISVCGCKVVQEIGFGRDDKEPGDEG